MVKFDVELLFHNLTTYKLNYSMAFNRSIIKNFKVSLFAFGISIIHFFMIVKKSTYRIREGQEVRNRLNSDV